MAKKKQLDMPELQVILIPGPAGGVAEQRAKGEGAVADVIGVLTGRGPT